MSMSEIRKSKRLYKKVPANFSKMTDQQIDDWANQIFDDLMSVVGDNFSPDEETASEEVPMELPVYLSDPGFFSSWSLGADHPTQGSRYSNVKAQFAELTKASGIRVVQIDPRTASRQELMRVHSSRYVEQVVDHHERFSPDDNDPEQAVLASAMVGATLQMLDALMLRKTLAAINFAGAKHHAQNDSGSGFCVFNDLAVAATIATQDHGLRIAIFDIDAHHGDGTENLTRSNPNVFTYSVHHFGIFPGTGESSGPADHVYNKPLRRGDGDEKLAEATQEFLSLVQEFKPDMIFVAAGADGHLSDPLAGLEYTVEGYEECARTLRKTLPSMPILIGGAGGYQPDDITPEIWAKFALQIVLGAKEFSTTG
jgi:acetoin utilization protein AcuC